MAGHDSAGKVEAAPPDVDLEREGKDRQFVTALARGLEVLRAFRPGDVELGNLEIAERTGLPKPTAARLTYTLTRLGYLSQAEAHGKYRLAAGVLALGYSLLAGMGLRERARPLMQELADYTNASVALGSRDRLSMVYVECCKGPGHITLRLGIGDRVPIGTTAMGRALLASLPATERDFLMSHIKRNSPAEFPRIRDGIEQAVRDLKERGFVMSVGDWQPDVSAVGVPLIVPDQSIALALNCGGPAFLFSREQLETDFGPRLAAIAHQLSQGATTYPEPSLQDYGT